MSAQCEATLKAAAGAPMSVFERYLTVYALSLPIIIALAIDRLPSRLSLLGAGRAG